MQVLFLCVDNESDLSGHSFSGIFVGQSLSGAICWVTTAAAFTRVHIRLCHARFTPLPVNGLVYIIIITPKNSLPNHFGVQALHFGRKVPHLIVHRPSLTVKHTLDTITGGGGFS